MDHFYTTNAKEIGTTKSGTIGNHGYRSEGIECQIHRRKQPNTYPLYRYWNSDRNDHFYTISSDEIGTTTPGVIGKHGYKSEGIAGYCFKKQLADTVPLYGYWNRKQKDHLYTTSASEIGTTTPKHMGKHGYISEGITCYVIGIYIPQVICF